MDSESLNPMSKAALQKEINDLNKLTENIDLDKHRKKINVIDRKLIMKKHINPLIEECNSLAETIDCATNLLDYLSIMESGEPETYVDSSVIFWLARIAVDALKYSAEIADKPNNGEAS